MKADADLVDKRGCDCGKEGSGQGWRSTRRNLTTITPFASTSSLPAGLVNTRFLIMTSHLIETLAKRAENHDTSSAFMPINADCAFCRIIHQQEPAFKVYENDHVLAILGK